MDTWEPVAHISPFYNWRDEFPDIRVFEVLRHFRSSVNTKAKKRFLHKCIAREIQPRRGQMCCACITKFGFVNLWCTVLERGESHSLLVNMLASVAKEPQSREQPENRNSYLYASPTAFHSKSQE